MQDPETKSEAWYKLRNGDEVAYIYYFTGNGRTADILSTEKEIKQMLDLQLLPMAHYCYPKSKATWINMRASYTLLSYSADSTIATEDGIIVDCEQFKSLLSTAKNTWQKIKSNSNNENEDEDEDVDLATAFKRSCLWLNDLVNREYYVIKRDTLTEKFMDCIGQEVRTL
jgi:hypothetical protein